jgi:hypothetical protein
MFPSTISAKPTFLGQVGRSSFVKRRSWVFIGQFRLRALKYFLFPFMIVCFFCLLEMSNPPLSLSLSLSLSLYLSLSRADRISRKLGGVAKAL